MRRGKELLVAVCRALIISVFWLAIHLGESVTVRGIENDKRLPRTYLGMTHKRDIDPFVLIPSIIAHRGWKALAGDVHFALRGDGFTRGFLSRMLGRPAWLARLLYPLSVGPILRGLGTHPIEGLFRPAEEWIREAIQVGGDLLLAEAVLSPEYMRDFVQASRLALEEVGRWPLAHLLAWRYHSIVQKVYGPEILRGEMRRAVTRRIVARVRRNLDEIVTCFWEQRSFFGSPEAHLSPDGTISPLNAGFHRIVRAAPPDLRVVPISLIYDFMTTRRQRVFVSFASAIEETAQMAQDELAARLRQSWLREGYFTCTQLASGFLVERQRSAQMTFSSQELAEAVSTRARALSESGRRVDPQLVSLAGAIQRTRGYLAYVERRQLIRRLGTDSWSIAFADLSIHVGLYEVAYDRAPLAYAYNELQDLLGFSENGPVLAKKLEQIVDSGEE